MLKVGDKVKIKDISICDEFYVWSMQDTIGKIGTVTNVEKSKVRVEFEDDFWYYKHEDVEKIEDLEDLMKTGRVAELRNGDKYLIIRDIDSELYGHQEWALVNNSGFAISSKYTSNLKNIRYEEFDIVRVYQTSGNDNQLTRDILDIESKDVVVWERKSELVDVFVVDAVHFGNSKTYRWITFEDLNIKSGDIVEVETAFGPQLVQVERCIKNMRYMDDMKGYKKVIKKVGV